MMPMLGRSSAWRSRSSTADEGKADAQLEHEVAEVLDQPALPLPLAGRVGQGEEVEDVGVFEDLLGQVGLHGRQRLGEVRNRLALAAVEIELDLMHQHGAGPAIFGRLLRVPESLQWRLDLFN
jgi:hypothetical protein